ncbi:hypothetical protein LSCM1_00085 [Leishmania martiniquensis]|uniref:Cyclic nucleotide-binding domain-containing protein n=1 Tax=Leishmania martiniquensis TaxID=1580590 RepID=A0A836K9J5_9TRYP|nr:hypothetical protein LSCM1_00085 [Leishmania martiniquensis]
MPTSSQVYDPASAPAHRSSAAKLGPPPRASSTAPPLPKRFPGHVHHHLPNGTASRRSTGMHHVKPMRRDSSIGATSTNPRLRCGSVIDAAAQRSSLGPRASIDFASDEGQDAICRLRRLFLPVVMRVVLRCRRCMRWKNGRPPRRYTPESVVAAIMSSKSQLAECPQRMLESLAEGAMFRSFAPKEIVVYANEPHVSCGIVVLLYGELEERRQEPGGRKSRTVSGGASRAICTQARRLHKAMSVLCLMSVMCEDRATSFLATRDDEEADVAIIPSRWFWEITYRMTHTSLHVADAIGRNLRDVVLPHRRDMLLADYFPTSAVLLRSWMWSLLTPSDRVKLSRAMEVRVLSVGDVLFEEGDYCPYIYVVRRGALIAIVKGEALAVVEAGAAVGEESVLFHDRRNCSLLAATVCELYALHVRHLLHRFLKYPERAQRIIAAAMERQARWMEEGRTRDVFGLVSILSGVPCLGHTTDAMREEIARCATVLHLPQGHTLTSTCTPCTFFCVIGRGSVTLKSAIKTATVAELSSSSNGTARGVESPVAGRWDSLGKQTPSLPSEVRREARSAGDFFGELCLKPHLWPYAVVCDSTVSVWKFEREAVLRVLEKYRADAQAIEVCRQGISLYRAQRGESSIVECFDAPVTPNASANGWHSRASSQRSRAQSTDLTMTPSKARSNSACSHTSRRPSLSQQLVAERYLRGAATEGLSPPGGRGVGVDWTPEQWTTYAITRLQEGLCGEKEKGYTPAPTRDLREVDKEVEKTLNEKVLRLVAVQLETPASPADCDISGDAGELQTIIVEQLFLIETEKQPRFLRQVKDSNVRLVTDDDGTQATGPQDDSVGEASIMDTMHNAEAPVAVSEVMQLEEIGVSPLAGSEFMLKRAKPSSSVRDSAEAANILNVHHVDDVLDGEATAGAPTGWPVLSASLGRTRRSTSLGATGEASGAFAASLNPRASLSRSHFVRPPSGMPPSPRCGSGRDDFLSSTALGATRPMSSSESRVMPPVRARPTSVDFNQFSNKLGVDRHASLLDRYVKIEDQNYFDDYVKVLPLQRDEMWAPDEATADSEMGADSMVLLLLHVLKCDHLSPDVMQRCRRPIVKATLGQRALVRTSVMENCTSPCWAIEHSSFISFVRRGNEIIFSVCDADDESRIVYQTSLSTASIHENGGVGQRAMTLRELSVTGFPISADLDSDLNSSEAGGRGEKGAMKPHMTVTMLAVTASKYKVLRQYFETREKSPAGSSGLSESATLFLQVMSVEGLRHRIEAGITVSLYNGGTTRTLLETDRVRPKTRSPAWPGEKSFAIISSDGGVLTFDLCHKDSVIASAEATVDELIFGGIGLRRLPLLQAQTGRLVIGSLVVSVLGARMKDGFENRSRDWVTHLAVEELSLAREGFSITPDPFIVLRDGTGAEKMRTPLVFSAFEASWTMSEASCLLRCPRLCGSTVSYQLEVCDSDEKEVVGCATITLSDRGLGPGHRHSISLSPPGRGVVRLRSLCLPVFELPARGAAYKASMTVAALGPPSSSHPPLSEHATLLLLHVSGCTELPGGATAELQTDAIGTFSVDSVPYLRTSLQEATTKPRWPFSKASVLLRIPSPHEGGNKAAVQVDHQQPERPHQCLFAVYDGVVDNISLIGQVAVPLPQLLNTALHRYPLFPRCKHLYGSAKGTQPSLNATTRARVAADRTVGYIQVFTLLGSLDRPARTTAEQGADVPLTSMSVGADTPSAHLPYCNPEGTDGAALDADVSASRKSSALAPTVVLSVSSICDILPSASDKYVRLVVRHGPHVLLSVEREIGSLSHAEWGPTDACAAVPCGEIPRDGALVVELTAVNVVEGGVEAEGISPTAAASGAEVSANGDARRRSVRTGSDSAAAFSLGHAALPVSRLLAVEAGEVQVVTLTLSDARRTASLPETVGCRSTVLSAMPATREAQEALPAVSFSIFGNRS